MVSLLRPSKMQGKLHQRIEILGVFGSGKTSFAHTISDKRKSLLLERHEHNIFWHSPMSNQAVGFLAYDLSFLLQHHYLVATSGLSRSENIQICDWSFASDELWASLRLDENDFVAYRAVHRRLLHAAGPPLGYIYLKMDENTINQRLKNRNRDGESFTPSEIHNAVNQLDALVQTLSTENLLVVEDDTDGLQSKNLADKWIFREMGQ